MNCLRPLEHRDHGFEFHSRHGYLCAFNLCLCCPVYRLVALRRADPRPENLADCVLNYETEKSVQGPTRGCKAIDE
jgi:hypothetical protein